MDTEDRLEVRQSFDKKTEWKLLNELMTQRQAISEKISCLSQEIVALRRKGDRLREEYHTELCKVKPSVIGPKPGEREKARKQKSKVDKLVSNLKGVDAEKLAKLADLLNL